MKTNLLILLLYLLTGTSEKSDVTISMKFDELTITAGFEEIWNEEDYFDQTHSDTILVELGLVSKISGQTFSIDLNSPNQQLEVFQNYETSLTLMDEGPHIDLTDWKHYSSEWKQIEIINNEFRTIEYTDADNRKFPDVSTEEIYKAVSKHMNGESNKWTQLAKQCSGAKDYPCGVSISRINLKLILTDYSGSKSIKYIIFDIPMGC